MFLRFFRTTPTPLLVFSAFAFGTALFAVRFPDAPGASLGSYVSSVLISAPAFLALFAHLGVRRATASIVAVSVFAYAIESFGVATGFPYGPFFYGEALGPKLFGLVPLLLPVTYVPLVIGAAAAASRWTDRLAPRVLLAAVLLVLIDGALDPGATALGFWTWTEGGPYYGVPLTNYAGWLLSGLVSATLLLAAGRPRTPFPPGALDSAILSLAFWTGANAFAGLAFPAALGLFLFFAFIRQRSSTVTK